MFTGRKCPKLSCMACECYTRKSHTGETETCLLHTHTHTQTYAYMHMPTFLVFLRGDYALFALECYHTLFTFGEVLSLMAIRIPSQ